MTRSRSTITKATRLRVWFKSLDSQHQIAVFTAILGLVGVLGAAAMTSAVNLRVSARSGHSSAATPPSAPVHPRAEAGKVEVSTRPDSSAAANGVEPAATGVNPHAVSDPSPLRSTFRRGPNSVAGTTYEDCLFADFSWPNYGTADYNLNREFKRLEGTIGIADDSASGAAAEFEIDVDGQVVYTKTLALGQAAEIDVSLRDGFRMSLTATTPDILSPKVKAVWADLRFT